MRTASTSITITSSSLKKNEVFLKSILIDISPDIIKHSLIPAHQDPRSTLRFLLIDNPLNIFCIFPFFITYYSNPILIFPNRMFLHYHCNDAANPFSSYKFSEGSDECFRSQGWSNF